MYNYGLIGNCQMSAFVSNLGSIDWLCAPRPDSEPLFGKILDPEGGFFGIESDVSSSSQSYIANTNVLTTTVTCKDLSRYRITDFCPRFYQHGRIYRPLMLLRKIEPLEKSPTLRIQCQPINGWAKKPLAPVRGNSHLRYERENDQVRLITNMPMTYLTEETTFSLKDTIYFGLSWGFGIEDDLILVTENFLKQTIDYWNLWVKHCSIPTLYQKETLRSALTLKLHCYEDTGAILAALTTSLPEEYGQNRNWDYRFCWLRDAYFTLSALNKLGHFEEMEGFIKFLLNIAEKHDHSKERLRPVYKIDQSLPLPEVEHNHWQGYFNSRPVRTHNQAAEHVQNDVYGEMVLTLAPIFFDERFHHLRTTEHEALLRHLGKLCLKNISQPDAGLWEIRNGWQVHTFSNLMNWAGLDKIQKIQSLGYLKTLEFDPKTSLDRAEKSIRDAIVDQSLRNGPQDPSLDSALLLLPILGFPDRELCVNTIYRIREELEVTKDSGFLYRYLRKDDFGKPKSAFLVCSFWLVQSLAKVGFIKEAESMMKLIMPSANHLGLFSEHYDPITKQQAGNFPQAYSHVGQINSAFAISPEW